MNHGGIIPDYMLNLWGNDKPAWVLRKILYDNHIENGRKNATDNPIVWIPNL